VAHCPAVVSVIVPTYRRPERLRRCLECLADQTFRDFEVCVVNDGGPSVAEVVGRFTGALSVHLYQAAVNRGHVPSRNKGLQFARGELIALCDDDDEYAPDHLASLAAALGDRDLVYSGARIRAHHGDGRVEDLDFNHTFDPEALRKTNFIIPSSILYRRRLHAALGPFDEIADQYWDWDWVLRVASAGTIGHVPAITLTYAFNVDGGNMSEDPDRDRAKLEYLCDKHGLGTLASTNFYRMAVTSAAPRTSPGSSPGSR